MELLILAKTRKSSWNFACRPRDAQTVLSRANQELTDATTGPGASRTTATKAKANMAGNVAKISEEIGAHPGVAEAAAHGHALFAAQNGIDDVSQAAARTELGNNRLIDNFHQPLTVDSIKTVAAVAKRAQALGKAMDEDTDAKLTRTMTPPEKEVYKNPDDVSDKLYGEEIGD